MRTRGNGKSSISYQLRENYSTILKGLENSQLHNLWCVLHATEAALTPSDSAWVTSSVPCPRPCSAPVDLASGLDPAPVWSPSFPAAFYSSQSDCLFQRQRGLLPCAFVISASSNVSGLTCSRTHGSSSSWSRVSGELSYFEWVHVFPLGLLHGFTFTSVHRGWDDLGLGL